MGPFALSSTLILGARLRIMAKSFGFPVYQSLTGSVLNAKFEKNSIFPICAAAKKLCAEPKNLRLFWFC
jgi:hypothetical protein